MQGQNIVFRIPTTCQRVFSSARMKVTSFCPVSLVAHHRNAVLCRTLFCLTAHPSLVLWSLVECTFADCCSVLQVGSWSSWFPSLSPPSSERRISERCQIHRRAWVHGHAEILDPSLRGGNWVAKWVDGSGPSIFFSCFLGVD